MADYSIKLTISGDGTVAVQAVDRVKAATAQMGKAGKDAGKQAEAGFKQAEQGAVRLNEHIGRSIGFLKGFVGALVSIQGIKALAGLADSWSDMTSRIKVNIGANEDAAAVMARLAGIARTTYSSMELTADSFARNAITLNALGKSTKQQLDYTSALNNALVVSGAKAQMAESVQNALSKAMATGSLRGEELNSVLTYGGRIAEALAEELGTTTVGLRQMGADGKITGDIIFNSLTKRMQELEAEAESMPATLGDAFTLLRNSLLQLVGMTDQQSASSEALAEMIIKVADAITIVAGNVSDLVASYDSLDSEQQDVATSATDIAYAMKTVVTGVVIAKNTIDVLIDGFKLAGETAGTLAAAIVDSFTKSFTAINRLILALTPGSNYTLAQAFADNLKDMAGVAGMFDAVMAGLGESTGDFWTAFKKNQDDVSKAFEFLEAPARKAAEVIDGAGKAAGAAADDADALAGAMANLYTNTGKVTDATGDVDNMIRDLAYSLADDATRALMDYEDTLDRIMQLEMAWLDLGPMSEIQIRKLAELRALSARRYERDLTGIGETNDRTLAEMNRGWSSFADDMAGAILDGSKGVKRWFKAMLDDMKRQLLASGILKLMQAMFGGGAGGMSMAGAGGGTAFGQIVGSFFGKGAMTAAGGNFAAGIVAAAPWLGAAAGAVSGYNRSGIGAGLAYGAAGWVGGTALYGGALGYAAGAATGVAGAGLTGAASGAAGAAGGAFGAGAVLPIVGWIAVAAAIVDMVSGGKLFGTKFRPESSDQALTLGAGGGTASAQMTMVKNQSLFRGRKWETRDVDPGDEARAAAGELYDAIYSVMADAAQRLAIDTPPMIDAAIRTVTEYDKKGRVTATKIYVDAIGRTWLEATAEAAASRLSSEALIATIDAALAQPMDAVAEAIVATVQEGMSNVSPMLRNAPILFDPIDGPGGGRPGGPGTGTTPPPATGIIGEASAIAERWRSDAAKLAEGAEFLMLAVTDMRHGFGLLGDGTLTQITALIEDMQRSGETLPQTYARVAASTALLDAALALSGVQIDGTREHIVRLAADIADAAGGLERAGALWSNYFDRFYSDTERAQLALSQALTAAGKEFGDIGLSAADFSGAGGMAAFRTLFEQALPTLSADAVVQWLEAAAALGIVVDATEALNQSLGEVADAVTVTAEQLADRASILADIGSAIEDFGLSDWERQLKAIAVQTQSYIDGLIETGLSLDEATAAAQAYSDAALAAAEAQRAEQQAGILADIAAAIADLGLTDWERQLQSIATQTQTYIDGLIETGLSLDEATAAAGAYSDAALAAAEAQRAAQQTDILGGIARAIADLGLSDWERQMQAIADQTQSYIDQLVETGMSLEDATVAAGAYSDAMTAAAIAQRDAETAAQALAEAQQAAAEAAQQAARQSDILQSISDAIADLGLTDWERQLQAIERQTQDYIAGLVETGMGLDAASAAAGAYRDAMIGAAEAQRAATEAAEAARLQQERATRATSLTDLLSGLSLDDQLATASEMDAAMVRLNQQWAETIRQAIELGANEEQLASIRAWQANAVERMRAEALATYQDMAAGLADELSGLSEFGLALRDIGRWTQSTIDDLNRAARAAGMQGAAESDLANVHKIAAARAAAAIAQLRDAAASLVTQLFGPGAGSLGDIESQIAAIEAGAGTGFGSVSDGIDDAVSTWLSGIARVQSFLDGILLNQSLTTLTPQQQLAEAQSQYDALLAAAQGGDSDALAALPDAAQTLLDLARNFYSSGDDYTAIFDGVRDAMQGLVGMPGPTGGGVFVPGGGIDSGQVSGDLAALYAERDRLLAEQEAQHRIELMDQLSQMVRELIQATGDPLADVAASIGLDLSAMAESIGINLSDLSVDTALSLAAMAQSLGVDVSELAANVGLSLGTLADKQSLLNQALDATLLDVPDDIRAQLAAPLDAIRNATDEADANAAIAAAEAAINEMPAGVRDMLAPYFAGVSPANVTTQLTTLADISGTAAAQLAAAETANGLLDRIAANLGSLAGGMGVPAYAAGGWVHGPTTILAGEAGRELILPHAVSEFFVRSGIPVNGGGSDPALVRQLIEEVRALRAERTRGDAQVAAAALTAGDRVAGKIDTQTQTQERATRELVAMQPRSR